MKVVHDGCTRGAHHGDETLDTVLEGFSFAVYDHVIQRYNDRLIVQGHLNTWAHRRGNRGT